MDASSSSSEQTWVPYEPTKDCSMGFCSIYCPQWCYIIFPPPPPVEFADETSSSPTFSPIVIAIIGILASAFLLVSYYTIISKYCGGFDSLRRRLQGSGADDRELEDNLGQSHRNEAWNASPADGLDEALINKITVYKYRRGEGLVDGTDCSVCLGEFQEDDSLRLLPKCSHAFHIQCIDTWLKSHSNCPLCRANIANANPPPQQQLSAPQEPESRDVGGHGGRNDEIVVVIEDAVVGGDEEHHASNSDGAGQPQVFFDSGGTEESNATDETREDDGVQSTERSTSMASSGGRGRISIADVLRMSWEDEMIAAKESGYWTGASSSERGGGEHNKGSGRIRGLHYVMNSVSMKRSLSGGRFTLARNGRGRNTVLPV